MSAAEPATVTPPAAKAEPVTTGTQPEAPKKQPKGQLISEGPQLFIGNSETTEDKKIKSLNKESVPDKQQWIEFVVYMKNQEAVTMYSPKLLAFNDKGNHSYLQLYKYKTDEKKEDKKSLKDTPIDDGFNFTEANLVIKRQQPEDKSFKYVISIRSEKGKEDNLYERLIDDKNKDAAWELKLTLEDETDKSKFVELTTFPFRIDKSITPYSLVNVLTADSAPWYKNWKWLLGIAVTLLIIGLIAYFMIMKRSEDSENYE